MAETRQSIWRYRALFVFLAATVVFVQLLPLHAGPGRFPGPDILLLIVLSWTMMRPEIVPLALLASVFLFADFLLTRPPGLWTAIVILGCEFLRSRRVLFRGAPFPVEWALMAVVIAALVLANALVLSIFAVPQPSLGYTVISMVLTILAYPVVLVLAGRAFGLRKPSSESETLGSRL